MIPNAWKKKAKQGCAVLWAGVAIHAAGSVTFTSSNTNFLVINTDTNPPTKAAPYPLPIVVAGLPGRVVTKATVTLNGLNHESPSDVSLLLVSPQGQSAIIMSEVGGQYRYPVTNLTLTLDDDAANPMPVYTPLTSGTFKPTDGYQAFDFTNQPYDFPPPAPPGNSNAVVALSVFKNTDPNGIWNLFIVDDAYPYAGSISNGWSLILSVAIPLQIARAQTNVVVSWPGAATNCTLQYSPELTDTWINCPVTPVLEAGRFCVTNPVARNTVFYRLVGN